MRRGFTLIELLAVIVILAIIALIATPIVLNIINDTKESSMLRSADFYIHALENEIMLENMKAGGNFNPNVCNVTNGNVSCDGKEINLKVDGEKPDSGSITFEDGKVTNVTLEYQSGKVTMNNKGELVFGESTEEKVTLVNYIKNLYSETKTTTVNNIEYSLDETHLLMNDRLGNANVGINEGNIRYYGANPNNYIDIGDRDSEGNIIFWRIIGLFKDIEVTDEDGNVIKTDDLVKIIRADELTVGKVDSFSWDYTSIGASDNNWNDSTLQVMLNDEVNGYYGSGTTNYYNNSTTATTLNFVSTGLSSEVHNKIERVKWSLGGNNSSSVYADAMYRYERAEGSSTWSGKVALMYPSDYGYSANLKECQSTLYNYSLSTCKTTSWLSYSVNQWTLIPFSSSASSVFYVVPSGYVSSRKASDVAFVRPVLYLNSNVGIVEERETSDGIKYFVVE